MSTVANPHIPLSTPIPGGFTHGKLIRIHGSTHHSPDRFDINLQCGPRMHHDDIALHVNPRFHQHTVVRNSLLSGSWGPEDTHQQHFPFHAGQSFELLLLADSNHYKVAVNGHHFAEFHFRMAPERVSHLTINGDVMISMVTFEGQSHGAPGMVPPGQLPPLGLVAPAMPSPHLTPVGPVPGHMPHPPMPAPGAPIGYPQQYPSQYPPGSQYGQQAYPQSHQYPSAFPGQPQPNSHAMGTGAKAGLLGGLGAAIGTAVMGRSMLNPLHGNRPSYPSVSPFPGQPGPLGTAGVGAGAGLLGGLGGLMGAAAVGKAILNPVSVNCDYH